MDGNSELRGHPWDISSGLCINHHIKTISFCLIISQKIVLHALSAHSTREQSSVSSKPSLRALFGFRGPFILRKMLGEKNSFLGSFDVSKMRKTGVAHISGPTNNPFLCGDRFLR